MTSLDEVVMPDMETRRCFKASMFLPVFAEIESSGVEAVSKEMESDDGLFGDIRLGIVGMKSGRRSILLHKTMSFLFLQYDCTLDISDRTDDVYSVTSAISNTISA